METNKKPQGFAAISPERQREIASKGGKAHSSEHMRKIGIKGGNTPKKKKP